MKEGKGNRKLATERERTGSQRRKMKGMITGKEGKEKGGKKRVEGKK